MEIDGVTKVVGPVRMNSDLVDRGAGNTVHVGNGSALDIALCRRAAVCSGSGHAVASKPRMCLFDVRCEVERKCCGVMEV